MKKYLLIVLLVGVGFGQDSEIEAKIRSVIKDQIKDGRMMFNFDDLGIPMEKLDFKMIERILNEEMGQSSHNTSDHKMMPAGYQESHPLLGKQFSEFKFLTLKGKSISSEKLKDKVVVLNAWFLACKPCILEIPDLNNIVNDYKNKDVEFLAITFDKKKDVRKFLRKTDFNYRHITDQINFMQENEIFAYPTHLVIDKSGKLVKAIVGLSTMLDEELRHAIDGELDL